MTNPVKEKSRMTLKPWIFGAKKMKEEKIIERKWEIIGKGIQIYKMKKPFLCGQKIELMGNRKMNIKEWFLIIG